MFLVIIIVEPVATPADINTADGLSMLDISLEPRLQH